MDVEALVLGLSRSLAVVSGFCAGTLFHRLIEVAVYAHHPAVTEGELIVEEKAVVIEAERELRRHG